MRTMLYMTRIAGMVIVLIAAFVATIIAFDIIRFGANGRGYMLGMDIWNQMRSVLSFVF